MNPKVYVKIVEELAEQYESMVRDLEKSDFRKDTSGGSSVPLES